MESRKRNRLLIALTAGMFAFGVWFFLLRNTEPTYEGKPLSYWVDQYSEVKNETPRDVKRLRESERALRAIGTNALPHLLDWVAQGQAPWRYHLAYIASQLPEWITHEEPVQSWMGYPKEEKRADAAVYAFAVLGPIGEPALPRLEQLIHQSDSPAAAQRALFAIAGLGATAVPIITTALHQPQFEQPYDTMLCAKILGTNARALTSILVDQLTNTNDSIAELAGMSFILCDPINFDSSILVPALISCLQDKRTTVRQLASFPLERFGAAAVPALPALTNALNDSDAEVRTNAAKAITRITKALKSR